MSLYVYSIINLSIESIQKLINQTSSKTKKYKLSQITLTLSCSFPFLSFLTHQHPFLLPFFPPNCIILPLLQLLITIVLSPFLIDFQIVVLEQFRVILGYRISIIHVQAHTEYDWSDPTQEFGGQVPVAVLLDERLAVEFESVMVKGF